MNKKIFYFSFYALIAFSSGASAYGLLTLTYTRWQDEKYIGWDALIMLGAICFLGLLSSILFPWLEYERAVKRRDQTNPELQE